MAPPWKISPPQTPHGSARSVASARQAVRSGHWWQYALACSSSPGRSENHRSPRPRWQGSSSASAADGRADAGPEVLGITILRARDASVRSCAASARDGTRRAGPAGELLGVHNVAVEWICWQRLEPPTSWMVALADSDLLHRDSFHAMVVGARSGPCALRAPDVRLWVPVPVSACDRSGPADIRHIADLAIRQMNVSGRPEHRQLPNNETRLAGQGPNAICRSAAQAAATATVTPEDTGRSSPPSSNSTTPLHSRLHPCSGWLATARAAERSGARAPGHRG